MNTRARPRAATPSVVAALITNVLVAASVAAADDPALTVPRVVPGGYAPLLIVDGGAVPA